MSLFREKSIDRVTSPEELNDYIRVSTPSVWLVLVATIIILVGVLVWSTLGTVEQEKADGTSKIVHPITFVTN